MIYERMRVSSTPSRGGALPTYQRKADLYAPGSGVSARIDDSAARIAGAGGDAEARALAGLGNAVKGAVDVGVKAYDDYQNTKATEAYNLFQKAMNEKMYGENGIFIRQGEAAFDSTENMESALRDTAEEVSRQLKLNEYAREKLNRNIYQFSTRFMPKAMEYASEQRMKWADEQDRASLDLNFEGLLNNADDRHMRIMYLSTMQKTYNQYAERNGFSPAKKELGWKRVLSGAYSSLADKFITNGNLNAARELVNEDALWLEGDQDRIRAKIKAEGERLEAKAEANRNKAVREILKGERDALYLAERGNVFALEDMTKRLRAVGATEEAEALENQTTAFRESAQVLRSAAELPLPEAMGKLREMDAELDTTLNVQDVDRHRILSSSRDMLARQLSARTNALQKDPAAAAESAAQFQPGQFQLPDDASMEDRAAARMGWQVKNGVSNPVPLTKHEVENLAEQYEKASSPGDFVAMLSESFGGQSGEALKQLVTSGKLPPDANLALNMPRESANLLMLMSRKDAVKETESALGVDNVMKQDIAEAVRDELEDILGTLAAQGGSHAAAQVLDSSYKLSLKYMERGMDAKDAGERAAREVMAERYEVRDSYRVPRDYDADNVASGARLWLKELASSGTVAMDVVPGLTEAQTKAKKAAILTGGGRWVNNADESGLLLTVNGAPILDVDGRLIQVKFEDLAAKGESWKEANALSGPARGGSSHTILAKNK